MSTSGQEMVGPIGKLLGASEVIATRMEVADGRYTGEMEFWAYGEAKASRVRELAGRRGYRLGDCYAYSDSVTDLPMLEAVGPSAGGESGPRTQENRRTSGNGRCWPSARDLAAPNPSCWPRRPRPPDRGAACLLRTCEQRKSIEITNWSRRGLHKAADPS